MDQTQRRLSVQTRPDFSLENSLELRLRRQWGEQRLHEPQANMTGVRDKLERGDIDVTGTHLTVPDYAVAPELKTRYAVGIELHRSLL